MNGKFWSGLSVAVVAGILIVAIVFRFLWLETIPGLNGDEAWLGWKAARAVNGAPLDWRTNSGNFTNPFFLLPLVWVHHFFEPSAWVVRSVAAISGVLTLLANYFFCRRIFDRRIAIATTLLLAVIPTAIAYSRFGWEPSQIPLFAVFIIYSALALCDSNRALLLWILISGFSVICGFLVHPTMAFLGLFPVVGFAARLLQPETSLLRAAWLLCLGVASAVGLGLAMYLKAPLWIQPEIAARFIGGAWLQDMPGFIVSWFRNFNGINIFGYLPGSWPGAEKVLNPVADWPVFVVDIVAWIAFFGATALILIGIALGRICSELDRMHARKLIVLLSAFLIASLLFGVMNGTAKVAVWFDRYGLWAVVPGCLVLCAGFVEVLERLPKASRAICTVGLLTCVVLLGMFWHYYFAFFLKTGGEAPWLGTRVGEPQGALVASEAMRDWATGQAPPNNPVLISSDWFAFWPIVYYMQRKTGAEGWEMIYGGAEAPEQLRGKNKFAERFAGREVVVAEFDGADSWAKWKEVFPKRSWESESLVLKDIAGRPNLRLDFPFADGE